MTSGLRAAAEHFLRAAVGPVAIEPAALERATGLVRDFLAGAVDGDALRAALGGATTRAHQARPQTVALLQLLGVLTPAEGNLSLLGLGTALRPFTRQVKAAAADDSVKAIAVVVDSPGGLLGMVPEAAAAMRAARQRKPVVVAVAGLNASAAYWITAGGSRMTATPSASVGAVGVFCVRPSIVRQLDQEGIDVAVFSAGKYKTEGLEVVPLTNAERSATQARVDEAYRAVRGGRRGGPIGARREGTGLVRPGPHRQRGRGAPARHDRRGRRGRRHNRPGGRGAGAHGGIRRAARGPHGPAARRRPGALGAGGARAASPRAGESGRTRPHVELDDDKGRSTRPRINARSPSGPRDDTGQDRTHPPAHATRPLETEALSARRLTEDGTWLHD